jgi:single-stranded DNA-specific DHH superfamily exonuclease
MKSIELYGTIGDNGTLKIANRERLTDWCKENAGKQVKIKVERNVAKRSLKQNDYYHSGVVEAVREGFLNIGYRLSHDETHYFLKERFNSIEIPGNGGILLTVPGSTAQLNKVQFSDYIERIAQFAAEYLGVEIKSPTTSHL